jgi:uncharacterized membrane protein
MVSETLYNLSVAFSLAAGSAAGLLSLLTWETLRQSPFGRAVFVLSIVLVLFIAYHVVLLVSPTTTVYATLVKSALFTGTAVFVWMLVWSQHRLRSRPATSPP